MITDFLMPKLAMAMNEGTVNEWLAQEGDYLEKGALVAVVETEKVAYEIQTPHQGYLHILVPDGDTVPVEAPIAQFASDEEAYQSIVGPGASVQVNEAAPGIGAVVARTAPPVTTTGTAGARIKASPLARKMAADRGMELAAVNGTGPGGRIVKRDILAAEQQIEKVPQAVVAPAGTPLSHVEPVRIPFRGMRATIARRMVESLNTSAQLSSFWEADLTQLLALRQQFVEREEQLGTRVSINAFLIKAIACAATQVPIANAMIEGEEIVVYRNVNVGIATALPGKSAYESILVVPVLNNVQSMGVVEIDKAMKSLIERARRNELGADELTGSTITLSTTAGLAAPGTRSTPVLNAPNTTLVGPSTPEQKPVVRNGDIVVRTMLPISVTFDHRVMDGEPAARFGRALHDAIENPGLMLG